MSTWCFVNPTPVFHSVFKNQEGDQGNNAFFKEKTLEFFFYIVKAFPFLVIFISFT